MRVKLKPGPGAARLLATRPEMILAAISAAGVWEELGQTELVITSGGEGAHSHRSHHYKGDALDFRSRDLGTAAQRAVDMLQEDLGSDFLVLLEETHIHCAFRPQAR